METREGKKKLVILDRDGVINEDSDNYVRSVDEWRPIPGSVDAIARLFKAGYLIAVATNQSGVGRRYFSLTTLHGMHNKMTKLVEAEGGKIAVVAYCPHVPEDNCDCRKPKPGLIHQIENSLGISARGAYLIGDSLRDLQSASTAGCQPVLVETGKGTKTVNKLQEAGLADTPVYKDLASFVDELLS